MRISIITASYNMLPYLKRARASVADQAGVEVEHIVADGGSTDGTLEWLRSSANALDKDAVRSGYSFLYFSGPDEGMYDALNKGFDAATGDVVAWLNCDEQYLEGTLARVQRIFEEDPELDILFGGALLVDPDGGLLSVRRAYPARHAYIATSHLYNLSCAMFFRNRVWQDGFRFDTSFRNLGDHDLLLRALAAGRRTKAVPDVFSVFSFTGSNLSWTEGARREALRLRGEAPLWARLLRIPLNMLRLLEKFLHGGYSRRPVEYALFTTDGSGERRRFRVARPSVNWPKDE